MTITFTLFSEEIEDFALEIQIDADARFSELHQLILDCCQYAEHPQQCFLICDEDWHLLERVRLTSKASSSDEDEYLMDGTSLREFIEEDGQHVAYRFDPEEKRHFLLDVAECSYGKSIEKPIVSRRHGNAPEQFLVQEATIVAATAENTNIDEEFYGNDGFEADEIDEEGFEIQVE